MRVLVLAFLILQSATSFAQVTSNEMQHFACGWGGGFRTLALTYDGPRYGDGIFVSLQPETVSNLKLPSDVLEVKEAKVVGFMTMFSCEKSPAPGVLIRCTDRSGQDHGQNVTLKFERKEKTIEGIEQRIEISREVLIKKIDIVVKEVGANAVLQLTGEANNGLHHSIPVNITQNVGQLGVAGGCRFEAQSWLERFGD